MSAVCKIRVTMSEHGENFMPIEDWWDYPDTDPDEKSRKSGEKDDEEDKKGEEERQDDARRDDDDEEVSAISVSLSELTVGPADNVTGIPSDRKPQRIRLLSWNLDGLDQNDLGPRTLDICKNIVREEPHVVFLQEVIIPSLEILKSELPMYYRIPATVHPNFVTILLRKDVLKIKKAFGYAIKTNMEKHILSVECTIKGETYFLMTARLDSTGEGAGKRQKQLRKAFSWMEKCDPDQIVIYGGDLNLRNQEAEDRLHYSDVQMDEKSQSLQSPLSGEDKEENKKGTMSLSELTVGPADSATGIPRNEKPHRIRLLSWNIDGLDRNDLRPRTLGICKNIVREEPHVVFLQEVIFSSLEILKSELPMYYLIPATVHPYFVAILLRKDVSRIKRVFIYPIPTIMGRHILSVECTIKGEKFCLMTAHLESMRESAAKRRKQLKKAFSLMEKCDPDQTVIFGGDLNLRDQELIQIGGQPTNIQDIWEITGSREDAKFTWDLRYNDNSLWSGQHGPKPRFRFDRIYMKNSTPRVIEPVYFELIGFDRLPFCHRFCSDHWGLLTHFDILSKLPRTRYR